eukprot:5158175-Pleurochrysis_carterae.AAC.2
MRAQICVNLTVILASPSARIYATSRREQKGSSAARLQRPPQPARTVVASQRLLLVDEQLEEHAVVLRASRRIAMSGRKRQSNGSRSERKLFEFGAMPQPKSVVALGQ